MHEHCFRVEILPIGLIRPLEEPCPVRAASYQSELEVTGVWVRPLLVDKLTTRILHGHELYHVACELGLQKVPVVRLSLDDPAVSFQLWGPEIGDNAPSLAAIFDSELLLPANSVRLGVELQLPGCRVDLAELRGSGAGAETGLAAPARCTRHHILSAAYHKFGRRIGIHTLSAANLEQNGPETLVPHPLLRMTLEADPAMAAVLPASPCAIALGRGTDFPFRLKARDLLVLPPALLSSPAAMAVACRWGIEACALCRVGTPDRRRLVALSRYGAALMRQLPCSERSLLFEELPPAIGAELQGSKLSHPSMELLQWLAALLDVEVPGGETGSPQFDLLEGSVEQILLSNGDSRLLVDEQTGMNKYGTTVRPRPEAVHFSSSTASSISDYGFLYCDVLRRDLLHHVIDAGHEVSTTRRALSDAIIEELRDMCELGAAEADGAIAPSGTDAEVLAVMLARAAAPEQKLVSVLVSPEETGRGVRLAAKGCYFDEMTATGMTVSRGSEIWENASIELVNIDIRTSAGELRPPDELDSVFLRLGKAALDQGDRVLAHMLLGSKTGLSGPSRSAMEELVAYAPDRVDVVVDACQMRVDYRRLGEFLRSGWMVQLSGSKSLTGPPFSGALLFPARWRDRLAACQTLLRPGICYTEDWSEWWSGRMHATTNPPAFGAAFRWLPALLEATLMRSVPASLRSYALQRFRHEVGERLAGSLNLTMLPGDESVAGATLEQDFAHHSIVAFQVLGRRWDKEVELLDEAQCRRLFELLNVDVRRLLPEAPQAVKAVLQQKFHIGQPVELGRDGGSCAILRLVIGTRFFNIVGHAGSSAITAALESEIADMIRAVDKLEILLENWWRIRDDVV